MDYIIEAGSNLSNADLSGADLRYADLRNANLSGADLRYADLRNANLSGANLSDANLSDANLSSANLSGVIGLASKSEEMIEAKRILTILDDTKNSLKMSDWHTCQTTHCLAGWSEPELELPGSKASRKMPTLAKYFYSDNDEAMKALIRVANGVESIYN